MEEGIKIRLIDDSDWDVVQQLIHDGWNENHIFTKSKELLKWHYMGYGFHKNKGALALYDGDKMVGFRLMIPIELSLSEGIDNNKRIVPAGVSTLYYLDKEYRGMKLGLKMQLYIIEHFGHYFAIASNLKTSVPIHKKSGAFMLDTMYRYVCPLNVDFKNIMVYPNDNFEVFDVQCISAKPINIEPSQLALFWLDSVSSANVTSLARPKDYWKWRYIDSPIYKYHFFGGAEYGGIIIGRIENLYNEDRNKRPETVFRILEFIPQNTNVWNGAYDENMHNLLLSVTIWAKQQGCIAAEFYITTNHFDSILMSSGYIEINKDGNNKNFDCYSYFEPCCDSKRLCNVTVFATDYKGDFDFNNTYFTLSDADQDRPNIL